jgi:hypothetical protein
VVAFPAANPENAARRMEEFPHMKGTALSHTYNPRGVMLDARTTAFQSALQNYRAVLASRKLATDKDWSDTLGTPEEIHEAFLIAETTLNMATDAIDLQEIQMIRQKKLLTAEELHELQTLQSSRPQQGEKQKQD